MDRLAVDALPVYRSLVHEQPDVYALFVSATPVRELAHVHYGSRPSFRGGGQQSMAGIRAIPWIFGWTQNRLMLPSWLGVGAALDAAIGRGELELLRRMAKTWPYFDDLIGKLEMVLAKCDLDIARLYVRELDADEALFDRLAAAFDATVEAILAIRERTTLLDDQPVLQTSIGLRNPYVDVLSLLQVRLLAEKRALPEDAGELPLVDEVLGTTLNGVAQGLRNTG
jgi:phosphoenolpyruvate carboxylase